LLSIDGFPSSAYNPPMLANLVTLGRVGLVFVAIFLLYSRAVWGAIVAFALILAVILMDWLDGFLARRTHTDTPFGAVMDILGDRIVESALWIVFAHLRLVPIWIPIVVIVRGFVTDAFRSVALTQGRTPFGEKTMITGEIGRMIVSSRTSRALYAVAKAVTFCYLALYLALLYAEPESQLAGWRSDHEPWLYWGGKALAYFTVVFCLVRALPVVQDGIAQVRMLKAGLRG